MRTNPPFLESAFDDRHLEVLDRNRIVVDPEHARSLAWRGTEASGEFREVVGRVKTLNRVFPTVAVDEIVPLGNEIAERASLMAERDAAVHAAGALLPHVGFRIEQVHFLPIPDAHVDRTRVRLAAADLDETGWLTHAPPPRARRTPGRDSPIAP